MNDIEQQVEPEATMTTFLLHEYIAYTVIILMMFSVLTAFGGAGYLLKVAAVSAGRELRALAPVRFRAGRASLAPAAPLARTIDLP
jgi:predicted membrane channel-forming protein YqfA (hemolysin III family)